MCYGTSYQNTLQPLYPLQELPSHCQDIYKLILIFLGKVRYRCKILLSKEQCYIKQPVQYIPPLFLLPVHSNNIFGINYCFWSLIPAAKVFNFSRQHIAALQISHAKFMTDHSTFKLLLFGMLYPTIFALILILLKPILFSRYLLLNFTSS